MKQTWFIKTCSFHRQWLSNHGSESRRQQDESRSIRQMNENLKDDICMRLGLREITWCSPWQHNSEHVNSTIIFKFDMVQLIILHYLNTGDT